MVQDRTPATGVQKTTETGEGIPGEEPKKSGLRFFLSELMLPLGHGNTYLWAMRSREHEWKDTSRRDE